MSGGYKNRPTVRLHLSRACQLICHFNRRRARRFKPNAHTTVVNITQTMELLTNCSFASLWTVSAGNIHKMQLQERSNRSEGFLWRTFLQIFRSKWGSCSEVNSTDTCVKRTARRMEMNLGTYETEETVTAREECGGVIPRAFLPWLRHSKRFKLVY